MKSTYFLFLLLPFFSLAQTITGSFQHDGLARDYRLHLPPNLQPGEQLPLVLNLHGYTSNAVEQEFYSGMNAVADTGRFLVCYPNGVGNAWNVGTTWGGTADDVGFLSALIDTIQAQYGVDMERVYSCGMSNGGFMSYRLACELGDRIAAIASVTGTMTTAMLTNCDPVRPMPVMEIHGTADQVVAYNGSFGVASIPDVVDFWDSQNECDGPVVSGNFPDVVTNDQATASFDIHTGCQEGVEVILITVANGGHSWPGAIPIPSFGATCQDFSASSEIWNFFNRFKLDLPSAVVENDGQDPQVAVFPNPFVTEFYILFEGKPVEFARVFDARGRLVWQGAPAAIHTEAWPTGVYFLVVKMGEEGVCRKVVKR